MSESKFWRVIAVLLVAGLFYVGQGIREGNATAFPELTKAAFAGDVTLYSTHTTDNAGLRIVTTNEDGTVIRVWHIKKGSNQAEFYGEFPARKQ